MQICRQSVDADDVYDVTNYVPARGSSRQESQASGVFAQECWFGSSLCIHMDQITSV